MPPQLTPALSYRPETHVGREPALTVSALGHCFVRLASPDCATVPAGWRMTRRNTSLFAIGPRARPQAPRRYSDIRSDTDQTSVSISIYLYLYRNIVISVKYTAQAPRTKKRAAPCNQNRSDMHYCDIRSENPRCCRASSRIGTISVPKVATRASRCS